MNAPRKSQKGKRFTADYIEYDVAMTKGSALLVKGKKPVIGLYIIVAINTGLRVSDILSIKHSDLYHKLEGEHVDLVEQKTGKTRHLTINKNVKDAHDYYMKHHFRGNKFELEVPIFISQKQSVYATETFNTILKDIFQGDAKNISTHSLRKTFGRRVYDVNGKSDAALILLSEIFSHASVATTRRYLGLRQEEIDDVYLNL